MAEGLNTLTGYLQELSTAFNEGGFSAMADAFGGIVTNVIVKINEELPKIIELGLGIIQNIVTGISENLPVLMEGATKIILMLVDSIIELLPQILEMGIQLLLKLADGITEALPNLVPAVVSVITKIVQLIIENLPEIIAAALKIIVALVAGLIQAIPELIKAVPELIKAFVTAFEDNRSNIIDIGKDIVTGVWEGVKSMVSWFTGQVKGFFSGIVSKVKTTLKINSPSKVFAEIGSYMAEGLGDGFTGQMQSVSKQINGSIPTDISMTGQYDLSGGGTAKYGDTIIYVNNPQPSPSELARQITRMQKDLVLGYA
jgi:phage-related protein